MPPPSAATTTCTHTQEQVQSIAPGVYAATLRKWNDDLRLAGLDNHFLQQRDAQRPKERARMAQGLLFQLSDIPAAADEMLSEDCIRGFSPTAYRGVRALCHTIFPTSNISPSLDSLYVVRYIGVLKAQRSGQKAALILLRNTMTVPPAAREARRQNLQRCHHHHGAMK
ncbi:hypothetical protein E4U14_006314 [Claviceps sp. LM454 group G7]|nr:hypothetical protein E4U14_006314 [Claviceps sp. LM454 group G7]